LQILPPPSWFKVWLILPSLSWFKVNPTTTILIQGVCKSFHHLGSRCGKTAAAGTYQLSFLACWCMYFDHLSKVPAPGCARSRPAARSIAQRNNHLVYAKGSGTSLIWTGLDVLQDVNACRDLKFKPSEQG